MKTNIIKQVVNDSVFFFYITFIKINIYCVICHLREKTTGSGKGLGNGVKMAAS